MYKFKLSGKDYEVPNSWEEINLEQYLDIISMDFGSNYADINLIKIFSGMSDEDVNKITIDLLKNIKKEFEFLNITPNFQAKQVINIDGEDYIFKSSFNKLELGEIASISTFDSKYGAKSLPYTLAILLRKAIKDENGELVQEDYNLELIEERVKRFLKLPVHLFLGSINFFLSGIDK